jgi:hypothetical protein
MRITIICEDKYIDEVREKAKIISKSHKSLSIGASPNGEAPATHWICIGDFTNEGFKKIMELKQHCLITNYSPKKRLEELGLKIIK